MDLIDSAVYLQCLRETPEFVLFPYAVRQPRAKAWSCASKSTARRRMAHQVRECLQGPSREHAELVGDTSVACSNATQRVGRCGYLLNLTCSTSVEFFEFWRIVGIRRMEWIPTRDSPLIWDGRLRAYSEIALRNSVGPPSTARLAVARR